MTKEYKLQPLNISKDWEIKRNVFYDIDPSDNVSEDDKYSNIYCQEDMLFMTNNVYNLDLGWYGSDDLENETTGFMIVLFKGEDWNNCQLLELVRTKSKKEIIGKLEEIIEAVSSGFFDNKRGYKITEDQNNRKQIGQYLEYSTINNFNELIKS